METIDWSISIIGAVIYLINIISVLIFAYIIIDRLYISKKYNKSDNFDLYNDLFSWETFFISTGIVNMLSFISLLLSLGPIFSNFIFKILILVMFSAFFMKIVHTEKIMKIITYERHYYSGIVLIPIIVLLLIFNIPLLSLLLIFIVGSLIPFLVFFSFLRNRDLSMKNSIKICIGAIILSVGCILSAGYATNFIMFNDFMQILSNIVKIIVPILFIVGSLLIYHSIRIYIK
ncbi:MAG: hypothetical protein P8Y23_03540 [Candidatus Lokiarchaeota archaeon]|jgi:hypothetical protein